MGVCMTVREYINSLSDEEFAKKYLRRRGYDICDEYCYCDTKKEGEARCAAMEDNCLKCKVDWLNQTYQDGDINE